VAAAHGLAVTLVMTASAHFVPKDVTVMPNHEDMVRMVPPFVPFPGAMVYVSGVLELLGAVGLVVATTRSCNPRAATLVLSVDDKPSIQALERGQGYLRLSDGKAVNGFSHCYTLARPSNMEQPKGCLSTHITITT
jgi:hypothetical protein